MNHRWMFVAAISLVFGSLIAWTLWLLMRDLLDRLDRLIRLTDQIIQRMDAMEKKIGQARDAAGQEQAPEED
jgi:type II secretory pathway component PulJ